MTQLDTVKTLIDAAAKVCGSKKSLAEKIGVMPQHISQWASGHRKCQPDDIAALADIAGFDAMQFLARATVENTEGTKKGEVLKRSLGKYLLATGGAIASSSVGATTFDSVAYLIRCIERLTGKRFYKRFSATQFVA